MKECLFQYLIHYDIVDPTINIFNTIEVLQIDSFIWYGRKLLGDNWCEKWICYRDYHDTYTPWTVCGTLTYDYDEGYGIDKVNLRVVKFQDLNIFNDNCSRYIEIKSLLGSWIYHLYKNREGCVS